jgi:hypothetical protein
LGYIPAPTTTTLIPVGLTGSSFADSEIVMIRDIVRADVGEDEFTTYRRGRCDKSKSPFKSNDGMKDVIFQTLE